MSESRPPFPPFTLETAIRKVRIVEDSWNTCNPEVYQPMTGTIADILPISRTPATMGHKP